VLGERIVHEPLNEVNFVLSRGEAYRREILRCCGGYDCRERFAEELAPVHG